MRLNYYLPNRINKLCCPFLKLGADLSNWINSKDINREKEKLFYTKIIRLSHDLLFKLNLNVLPIF